jgi:hypothetical protein
MDVIHRNISMKCLVAATLAAFTAVAVGQDAVIAAESNTQPIQLQVLKSWKVDLGDRAVFLNRVAPPVLPTRPPLLAEPTLPPSATDLQTALRREGKKFAVFFATATVYDRKFTEIRWMAGAQEVRVVSNIDFNLIPCMGTVESADTVYSLLIFLSNQGTDGNGLPELRTPGGAMPLTLAERFPDLEKLNPNHAQYLPLENAAGALPQEKDLAALDALHVFFEANRQSLAEQYAKAEAARIEQERLPKEPLPKPKDAIIHYWKWDAASIQAAREEEGK